jgi:2-iminobutanoate/2-iminopropanoate deaminase
VKNGNLVFVSGQLPFTTSGEILVGSVADQTKQALENVRAIVESAGGELRDVAQVTVYVSDIDNWPEVNRVYQEFFAGVPTPPARAVVPVRGLHYGAAIEIQAIACVG